MGYLLELRRVEVFLWRGLGLHLLRCLNDLKLKLKIVNVISFVGKEIMDSGKLIILLFLSFTSSNKFGFESLRECSKVK